MTYSDETRRYLAKVSRVGIVGASLYALLYGMLHFFLMPSKYANGVSLPDLFIGQHNVFPEITVAVAGLWVLIVCGILSLTMKARPVVVDQGWIIGGKAVLLAAPFGFVQSVFGMSHLLTAVSNQTKFLFSFAILAAVFVGYALGTRGISVNQSFLHTDRKAYTHRVLKNTAVVFGVMLVSVLIVIGRSWLTYGEAFSQQSIAMQVEFMALEPLRTATPVTLAMTLGYPLLSVAARWNEVSRRNLFGKGTILLGWVTLGAMVLDRGLSVAEMVITAGRLTSDLFTEAYKKMDELQAMSQVISHVATVLGIWTLCLLLPALGRSKLALWGARGLLGVVVLRKLSLQILNVIGSIYQIKLQNNTGVGIIGGADFTVTYFVARVESWTSFLFTILSIAALVVLTIGLTRRFRVSKAFWCVPVLTVASIAASLVVSVIWELVMRETSTASNLSLSIAISVVTAVLGIVRSLVGIIALARTPADTVTPPPTPAEAPKPRVEDYLYQL